MLTKIFGDIKTGTLARLPFLGYTLLLNIMLVLIMMGIAASLGITEQMIGGDIEQTQQFLANKFGGIAILGVMLIMSLFVFATVNITAKRLRDMGLPGWISMLIIFILATLLGFFLTPEAIQIFQAAIFLALVLIPGSLFNKSLSSE